MSDPLESDRQTVQREKLKKTGKCTLCPPHGGENRSRVPRHSKQKPRYKQHRRK